MKIIDKNKLLGYTPVDDEKTLRIIISNTIKKQSNGEKVLMIEHTSFPKEKKNNNGTQNFEAFYKIANEILGRKIKNKDIEKLIIDSDNKIKNVGLVAEDISEVITSDPRFIILWKYNPNIVVNLYYNYNDLIFFGNYFDFNKKYNITIEKILSKTFWVSILIVYRTEFNDKIDGLGKKGFENYLISISNDEDYKKYINEKMKLPLSEIDNRILNIQKYLLEIA